MKTNELVKIGTEIVETDMLVDDFDENGEIVGQHVEHITKEIPIMRTVTREMTDEEVAEMERQNAEEESRRAEAEKAEANSVVENLIQAFAKADATKVQNFKTMFDGLKMVYDADNPEPYIEGVTVPQNNAYYLIDGKRFVYMDGQFVEF